MKENTLRVIFNIVWTLTFGTLSMFNSWFIVGVILLIPINNSWIKRLVNKANKRVEEATTLLIQKCPTYRHQ